MVRKCICGNRVVDNNANFCDQCGHQLAQVCQRCGQRIFASERYCPHCGEKIMSVSALMPKSAQRESLSG